MANTEGMSDADMARLLTTSTEEQRISHHPPSGHESKQGHRLTKSKSRSSWMRERMRMDVGDRPAATVIRPSPRRSVQTSMSSTDVEDPLEEKISEEQPEKANLPPLVTSIVERNFLANPNENGESKATTSTGTGQRPISLFSQSRNNVNMSMMANTQSPPSSGFPSVHVPFGTFVSRPNKPTKINFIPSSGKNNLETATSAKSLTPLIKRANPNDVQDLKSVCQRDAESLLQSLSPAEIQEQVLELESALSPQTIAFLRERRQKRNDASPLERNQSSSSSCQLSSPSSLPSSTLGTTTTTAPPSARVTRSEREEKERIANLLSSIRTHEDLDKAYVAEMGVRDDKVLGSTENGFNNACDLLRSTAPRQRLWAARVVSQHLRTYEGQCFYNSAWPFPTLLPVSLRCLLDERPSISCTNSYHALLYTYVLQSLYALIKLGAHHLHVVDVTGKSMSQSTIYQHYFLDDAIPTIPFGTAYPTMVMKPTVSSGDGENSPTDNAGGPRETTAIAYSTSASSSSSQSDGDSFRKDPMWTLLSKMRIIPRLAQLLENQPSLPPEAMVAVCGILAMLGVRSPGAATAIVQHPQIMSNLMERAMADVSRWHGNGDSSSVVLLPVIILLCTLARQSRVVAETIDEHFLATLAPPILAKTASSDAEYILQKWTLCLWRTLLRYGLGLSGLTTMITLSTSHLAVVRPTEHSVAVEFITAFSAVFDCIRNIGGSTGNDKFRGISPEARESLVMAGSWLSSTVRQTVCQLSPSSDAQHDQKQTALHLRLYAARLRLVSSFLSCESHEFKSDMSEEFKRQNMTKHACLDAGKALLDGGCMELALRVIAPFAILVDFELAEPVNKDMAFEASACKFVEASAMFMLALASSKENNLEVSPLASRFGDLITACIQPAAAKATGCTQISGREFEKPRRRWINVACFSIVKVFLFFQNDGMNGAHSIARTMVLALVGRLEPGDEAIAALLLSNGSLFQSCKEGGRRQSGISSMLLRELHWSADHRKQLQHSFKILRGSSISAQGLRSWELESLLSEAVDVNGNVAEMFLLPLGRIWLWQVLSGCLQYHLGEEDSIASEAASDVLESGLEFILELETFEVSSAYVASLDRGSKLYHLFNLCLLPEFILGKGKMSRLALKLFDIYSKPVDDSIGRCFVRTCNSHTQLAKRGCKLSGAENSQNSNKVIGLVLAGSETQALEDFVGDICDAYIGYGAQYEICTRCVRYFILPCFPTKIRCEVLERLREVHHLLTLPSELEDQDAGELRALLEQTITGGIHDTDGSVRDPPALLDVSASFLKIGTPKRAKNGYVFILLIALLVRSLAWSIKSGGQGLEAATARVQGLPGDVAKVVMEATSVVLSGTGTKEQIVDAVLTALNVDLLDPPNAQNVLSSSQDMVKRLQQLK